MAKKKAAVAGKMVRLELKPKDYRRLEIQAEKRGLTLSSVARMAMLAMIKNMEEEK